jgi:murein DD-endopeptidase MepM/ murein hydrolase activator NlpD
LVKIIAPTIAFLLLLGAPADASWNVSLDPAEIFQGSIGEIGVSGKDLTEVKGRLRDQKIVFFRNGKEGWNALLGIDLNEEPGPLKLVVEGSGMGQPIEERTISFRVKKRAFPTERIAVPESFDQIDEAIQRRIQLEQGRLDGLWRAVPRPRLWNEPFISPVPLAVTSPFGLRRIVNGSARSPHGGVDLKAALGAEVKSANDGLVALRDEFFFTGKTLVLDHGGGLYTMYFHLADFRVEEGAVVRKGEIIGLAGMTGRVTGPHLHWGVRLNGARVDPFALPGIEKARK